MASRREVGTDPSDEDDGITARRREGPGLLSRFPGMAYQCRNDPDWTMEFVSDGCLELTGYPPDAFVGQGVLTYAEVIHPDDRERVWTEVQRAIGAGQPSFDLQYRIVTADGEVRDVREQGHPVHSDEEELLGLEGFVSDMTELRALEAQLRHAQRVEGLGELTGAIAHDFNNYLTAIISPIEMVLHEMEDGPVRDDLVQARDAARRAATLTSQLLSFARRRIHSPRPIHLEACLDTLRYMLDRVTGSGVVVEYRLAPGLPPVLADASQLQQVLVNLVVNARDAMPRGGRILIATRPTAPDEAIQGGVALVVEDEGEGMDEATARSVFDPYFTTKSTGTGLGLSTAHGIVKQHGGEMTVDSRPGEGTRFTVLLPATSVALEPSRRESRRTEPAGPRGRCVLVVEDEDAVRRVAVSALTRFGYRVLSAETGRGAVDALREAGPDIDLLLTDLTLPDTTGADLTDEVRRSRPDLPVVVMSGHASGDVVRDLQRVSAVSFLEKPFMIDDLLAAVAAGFDDAPDGRDNAAV